MKFLLKPYEEWVWVKSYQLRNPVWWKEKDNDLLMWSHQLLKINKQTKNKMKALLQPNKIKVKINLVMVVVHQMMIKIMFMTKGKLKMMSKLMVELKLPK